MNWAGRERVVEASQGLHEQVEKCSISRTAKASWRLLSEDSKLSRMLRSNARAAVYGRGLIG